MQLFQVAPQQLYQAPVPGTEMFVIADASRKRGRFCCARLAPSSFLSLRPRAKTKRYCAGRVHSRHSLGNNLEKQTATQTRYIHTRKFILPLKKNLQESDTEWYTECIEPETKGQLLHHSTSRRHLVLTHSWKHKVGWWVLGAEVLGSQAVSAGYGVPTEDE